ncbi:hypothetical protein, partial [Burkholderia stagnalis]|uniref:hypothetical protein n=1 Tax=Burkholderia stagnalis TaxID=1503054 RepID=UPI0039BF5A5B
MPALFASAMSTIGVPFAADLTTGRSAAFGSTTSCGFVSATGGSGFTGGFVSATGGSGSTGGFVSATG